MKLSTQAILEKAVADKDLSKVARLLTPENLELFDETGQSILYSIAEAGLLGQVPPDSLAEPAMLQHGPGGLTPMHWAAAKRAMQHVPKRFITEANLLVTNRSGWTPMHSIGEMGTLDIIDPELVNERTLLAANANGTTVLHVSIGRIAQIPGEFLTAKYMLLPNKHGETPLFAALCKEQAAELPAELLTGEVLSQFCNDSTYFDVAGTFDQLEHINPLVLWESREVRVSKKPRAKTLWEGLTPKLRATAEAARDLEAVSTQTVSDLNDL